MSKVRNALTARSVVLSVLLGTDPPRLSVGRLVRTTELFGIAEGTTRTALSRMVASGEITATDGTYELTGPALLSRQRRQDRSRAGRVEHWNGNWWTAIIGATGARTAAERAALRATLGGARLAELREGVWLRPDNLAADARPPVEPSADGASGIEWLHGRPLEDARTLAARLWDLPDWARHATELQRAMLDMVGPLEHGDRTVLAPGFVLSAAVLRHFGSDPLLPEELLPRGWPGSDLRSLYERYDRAYRAVLGDWFRSDAPTTKMDPWANRSATTSTRRAAAANRSSGIDASPSAR